jgi:hypothetical protein
LGHKLVFVEEVEDQECFILILVERVIILNLDSYLAINGGEVHLRRERG